MLKRFVCMFLAASLLLSGCGGANDEEDTFSLSKSQQEKYAGIIEDELNSFYWHYDSSSLAYYEAKVPDDTDDNAQLFKASEESGFNMKSYAGKNAVCYTANLTHINSENAGLVYFYFVRNSIVGLFYSPAAYPSKYVGLNIRNVFTPYAGIKKNESDKEYLSDNYSGKKLNVLSEGFSSQYKTENGSLFAEIASTSVNIYRYSRGNIKKYAVLSSSQLESLRPISVSFTPDGGVAVIVGTATEGNDEMETERIFSEKVLFFNNSFSKQNYSIDLSNGSYSCVSTAGDRLVLINDKTTEFYENNNGNYVKTASYYTNIQATDFKEADIDKDGVNEYIITDGKDLYIYRINDKSVSCIWRTNVSADCYYGYIYTGDLNDDGTDEIYICDSTGTIIRYVIGKDGLISRNEDIAYSQRIYAGDFDNDGRDDYIFFDGENNTLYMRK